MHRVEANKIYNADCLEGMKLIESGTIDMILCDLPYGVTDCLWDSVLPFDLLWQNYKRIIKPNGAIVLTAQIPFSITLAGSNLPWLKYEWIWNKSKATGHLNAKRRPLQNHENILLFCDGTPTYNPQGLIRLESPKLRKGRNGNGPNYGRSAKDSLQEFANYPKTVVALPSEGRTIHSTQKPVALFEYLIRTYTNPGELVLDNCIGSGTTAVACINSGRQYVGFESDPKYHAIAVERVAKTQERSEDRLASLFR